MGDAPELWAHQKEALERSRNIPHLALLMSPGVGKTRTAVEILRDKFNSNGRYMRTLIVAPIIVLEQWKREILRFSKIDARRIKVLKGDGKKRLKMFQDAVKEDQNFVAICNYEGLARIGDLHAALREWAPEVVIADECHRIRSFSALQTKKLIAVSRNAKHRYALTGTAVLNSAMDLFSQFLFLNQGASFGENFFSFRGRYFVDKNAWMSRQKHFPKWVLKQGAIEDFNQHIKVWSVQARAEDCIDLPPLITTEVEVELAPDQARSYETMRKHFITEVNGQVVAAPLAITKTLRMQQILTGFISDTGGEPTFFKENPRLKATVELAHDLAEQGEKVIIWTNFKATYPMLAKALGEDDCVFLTGEQSEKEKNENIEVFCRGDKKYCIANPQAAGLGVNLTEAGCSIYYSRNYSLEQFLQSQARNFRGGSTMHKCVRHYHMVARNTLDEVVLKALDGKENLAEAILRWGRNE